MARPLRVLFAGAWYHIMNRGLEKRIIFRGPGDIARFLDLLSAASERFDIEVHAYCLMSNHYHLLLRTPAANLSEAMRHIDGVYTQAFNRAHGRDGPLFRGRYRSVLVQADRHLVGASRYIHLNPLEAGLTRHPEEWPHSSYRGYVDPKDAPPWLRTATILGSFGSIGARARHRQFVEEGVDPATRAFYEATRRRPILGTRAYRDEIAAMLGDDSVRSVPEVPDIRRIRSRPSLPELARAVEVAFNVPNGELRLSHRTRDGVTALARGAFLDLATRRTMYGLRDACLWLGYRRSSSGSTATSRFRTACRESEAVRAAAERVIELLNHSDSGWRRIERSAKT